MKVMRLRLLPSTAMARSSETRLITPAMSAPSTYWPLLPASDVGARASTKAMKSAASASSLRTRSAVRRATSVTTMGLVAPPASAAESADHEACYQGEQYDACFREGKRLCSFDQKFSQRPSWQLSTFATIL